MSWFFSQSCHECPKKTAHLCLLVFLCVAAVFAHPRLARGKDPEIYQAEAMISQGTDSRIHFQLCNYTTGVQSPTTLWSHIQKEFRCRISAQQVYKDFGECKNGKIAKHWEKTIIYIYIIKYNIYIYIYISRYTFIDTYQHQRTLGFSFHSTMGSPKKISIWPCWHQSFLLCIFVVWRRFQGINHTAAALRHLF